MKHYTYAFEKLEIWQLARAFKKQIYSISKTFPKDEMYALTSQIKRSAGSITANIAEGSVRRSYKDRAHFVNIAHSSAIETLDHLITSFDMEYIDESTYMKLRISFDEMTNKINAFHQYLLSKTNKK
jgi:four helix bundle protein